MNIQKTRIISIIGAAATITSVMVACQSQTSPTDTSAQTTDTLVIDHQYRDEISRLAEHPTVKEAFAAIESLNGETTRNHITLTEIPAPPFKEEVRARRFADMLEQAGADSIWIDGAGNVLALRKGSDRSKTVVIEGHLDTVFPEGTDVTVKFRGDTLFAPGVGDDTRGLAMLLTLLKSMSQTQLTTPADILFVGTVGEEGEGDLRGVKHLLAHGPQIASYLAVDGGGIGRITNQGIGSYRYRITFNGPGGHSYGAFGIVNPHFALANALSNWEKSAREFVANADAKTTYSVGVIGGGTSVNSIPYASWAIIDMRSEGAEQLDQIDKLLKDAIAESVASTNQAKAAGELLTVDIELIGNRPTGIADPGSPLVQRAMATAMHFGEKPSLSASSTNSNAPLAVGIPAVTIGRGGKGGGGHSLNEWWLDENGDQAIQYALLLLLAETGIN